MFLSEVHLSSPSALATHHRSTECPQARSPRALAICLEWEVQDRLSPGFLATANLFHGTASATNARRCFDTAQRKKKNQNLGQAIQNQDDAIQEGNKRAEANPYTSAIRAGTDICTVNTLPVCTQTQRIARQAHSVCRGRHKHLNLTATWSSTPASVEGAFFSKEPARMILAKIRYPKSSEFLQRSLEFRKKVYGIFFFFLVKKITVSLK